MLETCAATSVPLLHIADAVGARAVASGVHTLGLLGTRWVMEEDFYAKRLAGWGVEVVVPDEADRIEVDRVIFDELSQGRCTAPARAHYAAVVERLAADGAEAVVLGCTEIGLLIGARDVALPLIDSAQVHALAAVEAALST